MNSIIAVTEFVLTGLVLVEWIFHFQASVALALRSVALGKGTCRPITSVVHRPELVFR